MEPAKPQNVESRRSFFEHVGSGFYAAALASLLDDDFGASSRLHAAESQGTSPSHARKIFDTQPRHTHFEPKAKSVIHLFMNGGPSQMDLFDPKPELDKNHGKEYFDEIAGEVEFPDAAGALMRSPFKFSQHGECGMSVSEVMPHLAKQVDKIAFLRSMFTTNLTHEPALFLMHTGRQKAGQPSLGAWTTYGLGSENQNLPAYVVLPDPKGLSVDGVRNWSSGWLPPIYQGTPFREKGSPVLNLHPKTPRPHEIERARMQLLARLNAEHQQRHPGELELDARISSFELAARMQLSATEALDIRQETAETQRLYGLDRKETQSYGSRCLMARRLVERGVRFVQLFMKGQPWDTHTDNASGTRRCCLETDQPIGGLLTDLKRRGLLDSTLILWGGEFGRTPAADNRNTSPGTEGRDHHPYGFSLWLAGGGIRGGQAYGATDDFGYRAIENRTQVADLHATILHQMGLDHETLTYLHNSRDERLTDVYKAKVIEPLLA